MLILLSKFNMRLKRQKCFQEGPLVKGSEFDRRMLMLVFLKITIHEARICIRTQISYLSLTGTMKNAMKLNAYFPKNIEGFRLSYSGYQHQRLSRYLLLMVFSLSGWMSNKFDAKSA